MIPSIFKDPGLYELVHTKKNMELFRETYNVFQWIFCYRFLEDEIKQHFYANNPLDSIDVSIVANNISQYRGANLKILLITIRKYPHLQKYFTQYNSYEKITWESYNLVICSFIPNFNTLQFGVLLEKFFQKDDCPLGARFMFDFHNTQDWFEYNTQNMHEHRSNKYVLMHDEKSYVRTNS